METELVITGMVIALLFTWTSYEMFWKKKYMFFALWFWLFGFVGLFIGLFIRHLRS